MGSAIPTISEFSLVTAFSFSSMRCRDTISSSFLLARHLFRSRRGLHCFSVSRTRFNWENRSDNVCPARGGTWGGRRPPCRAAIASLPARARPWTRPLLAQEAAGSALRVPRGLSSRCSRPPAVWVLTGAGTWPGRRSGGGRAPCGPGPPARRSPGRSPAPGRAHLSRGPAPPLAGSDNAAHPRRTATK